MHVGIMGIGTYFPENRMSASEIARETGIPEDVISLKFGVKRKPIPGPGDTPSRMGIAAAKKAIAMAGIGAEEIGLVIWNGSQHKDYPCWLAGLKVAKEIGADRAWSFDMEAMCGSMMAALDVAKSLMLAREDLSTVLIVSGYRNGDLIDLSVPETRFMLDIGAGGAAVVLRKNLGRNEVLASAFKGDGGLSEDCVVPVFGAKAWPPRHEDLDRFHFVVADGEAFKKKLGAVTMPNFYAVVREAAASSGFEKLDYLAILHFKRSAHLEVLKELSLEESQSTYLDEYGHIGQNDQILSIELGLAKGAIGEGTRIGLVGAGLGFVWASTMVRWGRKVD
jgi:3-oxoacyl-[acyl-carrier-protein] synthase III